MNSYMMSDNFITVVIDNSNVYQVIKGSPQYDKVRSALKEGDWELVKNVVSLGTFIPKFTHGNISVSEDTVLYKERKINGSVVEHLLQMMAEGFDYKPLVRFLDKLYKNPNETAIESLYDFIKHHGITLAEDGDILLYKSLRPDWTDHYSGKILNKIGSYHRMERSEVNNNGDLCASTGYHAGSIHYVEEFYKGEHNKRVIVKVNPEDVVIVPRKENNKIRVCAYTVVGEYRGKMKSVGVITEAVQSEEKEEKEINYIPPQVKDWAKDVVKRTVGTDRSAVAFKSEQVLRRNTTKKNPWWGIRRLKNAIKIKGLTQDQFCNALAGDGAFNLDNTNKLVKLKNL